MAEVQTESSANGLKTEINDQNEVATSTPNTAINHADACKQPNAEKKRVWEKKPRYNGRHKKRQWENTDRNRQDDGDVDSKRVCINPEDRVKRRKYCILMGYAGAKYFGMQRNPDVNTIEEQLLKALLKNKLITEEGFNQPQTIHFQRAARTDKGVSAARQCCSMKLPEEIDLDQLNSDLPPEIKIFNIKRVTKGFNAKDQCNARSYSYTLPTVSFAKHTENVDLQRYRASELTLAKVNNILAMFEGTRNFHNFTSRKAFADPSANRFINSFKCGEPFLVNNAEFCVISVTGQSFMLHQIRKMIGLTLAVVRGIATAETINKSFKENRIDIPMAPGLGLVLDKAHYDGYNNRYGDDGMHELLIWDEYDDVIEEFREKFIHPVITETELTEQTMLKWLETLPIHSYDERPSVIVDRSKSERKNDDLMNGGDIELVNSENSEENKNSTDGVAESDE